MILSILNNHAHGPEVRAALNPSDTVWHAMGMTRREMDPVKGAYPTLLASLRDAFGGDRVPEVCAALRPPAMFWHPFGMPEAPGCTTSLVARVPSVPRVPVPPALSS
jgi:hypothetical protein